MKKGFTIVETLVAVTVLMIAISGPLTVSFRALNAAVSSKNQMIATFLAQDAVEFARNIKDNNISRGNPEGWLADIGECTPSQMCYVNTLTNTVKSECPTSMYKECALYKDDTGRYSQNTSGTKTPFYRTMYLQDIRPIGEDKEVAELVVDVVWTTGENLTASTRLRTKIYNIVK